MSSTIRTPLCDLLKIKYPIMGAGMGGVAGAELVSAVSNAGGIGTVGAIGLSPEGLRAECRRTAAMLNPGCPYGVDLLLPKQGGGARKTNKDYTGGQMEALVNVMIEEKVPLFVCAVGIPPQWVVDKLHDNGIVIMNMIGAPKHARKCVELGIDIVCAQGTEGGGHTGAIASLPLIPQVADICKGKCLVTAAGGVFDGRGVAACLALGACGVWVGSRFLATPEANASLNYKERMMRTTAGDTIRTEIYSGRPMRVIRVDYNTSWENKPGELKDLLNQGIIPQNHDLKNGTIKFKRAGTVHKGPKPKRGHWVERRNSVLDEDYQSMLVGQAVGGINDIRPAKDLLLDMVAGAIEALQGNTAMVARL